MVADPDDKLADIAGKILTAGRAERVKVPKRKTQVCQPISRNRPIGNVILNLVGAHIINILRIILPADFFPDAIKLAGLVDDCPYGRLKPSIFAVINLDPVHDDAGNCLHSIFTFPACFTQ